MLQINLESKTNFKIFYEIGSSLKFIKKISQTLPKYLI